MNWLGVLIGFLIVPYVVLSIAGFIYVADGVDPPDVGIGLFAFATIAIVIICGLVIWARCCE